MGNLSSTKVSIVCLFLILGWNEKGGMAQTTISDQQKTIKVFILFGQSNMLGFGRVGPPSLKGSLEYMIEKKKKYSYLKKKDGSWKVRNDVRFIHVMDKRGVDYKNTKVFRVVKNQPLRVSGNFGPELGFGYLIGDHFSEDVLILKACIGNRSLGWDLLPPGSPSFRYEDRTFAGYGETPNFWIEGKPKKKVNWYAGRQYDADVQHAKMVLEKLEKYEPMYHGRRYEITGFLFWQGHKDQNAALASRYEQNLERFIKSVRKDFNAPKAKFVIATIGFNGRKLKGHGREIVKAQLALDGRTGKYPEFAKNVRTIDSRPFWRDPSVSPKNQGHHYNHNAETYMEVGIAMGKAMIELIESKL